MKTFRPFLLLLAICLMTYPVMSRGEEDDGVIYHRVAPAQLSSASAYLLFRSNRVRAGIQTLTHVFLREPTEDEVTAYRSARARAYAEELPRLQRRAGAVPVPTLEEFAFAWEGAKNIFAVDMDQSLVEGDMYLLEVPPGKYVIYGATYSRSILASCNCFGTVEFDLAPGVITNIGNLFIGSNVSDNLAQQLEDDLFIRNALVLGQALVPASADEPIPPELHGLAVRAAEFRPVSGFLQPGAQVSNRLAPIPGILEYSHGRVITGIASDQNPAVQH